MGNHSSVAKWQSFRNACFAVVLLAASELAFASAGKVLFVAGPVSVERNGARTLSKGDAIEVGDIIVTGDKARAQLLMADGAKIALRAGTRFRIDEFTLPPAVTAPAQATVINANGKSVASLLKGGFRTQTGAIGRTDRAAYEVRTPVGTLGIRGTDYTAVFCVGDCTDAPGLQPGEIIRDGLYLGVTEGGIAFQGGGRQIGLGAGQYAFIPLSGARPEPLQTPPAFLEEDGYGPLTIGSGGGQAGGRDTAKPAANADLGEEFHDRRSPTDAGDGKDRGDGGKSTVDQPVMGTGPNGQPVDLTEGAVPNRGQDVAFSIGQLGNANGVDAAAANTSSQLVLDAAGNLSQFVAPLARGGATGTLAQGTSTITDTGFDAATGIRWGRWTNGAANVTPPAGQPFTQQLASQSLHWLLGPAYSLVPVLPTSGTATYVLVGSTVPTDTSANLGTLGAASFSADFTNRTVAGALTLNIDGRDWFASGNGTFAAGSNLFGGAFNTVQIGAIVDGTGSLSGLLVEPGFGSATSAGAGMSYNLTDSLGQLGVVSGVLVFQQGAGQPVPPPAPQRRDVAFSILQLPLTPSTLAVVQNPGPLYALDAAFNLTSFTGIFVLDPPEPATFAIGTSTVAESNADAVTLLRWGRWSGGSININTLVTGQTFTQDLAQQSLHWIETGNAQNAPVMPTAGTAVYSFLGATSPTDNAGNVGTLNLATFAADFTNQLVNTSLDLTVNGNNWVATGTGPIGALAGLAAHEFSGALTGRINPAGLSATGSFSGFFSAPGGTAPGIPGGAGFTYILTEGQGLVAPVTGAVVFRGP